MKRFRVFAGPNGSGKSTIIKSVREYIINDRRIQFGIYINADDIAATLAEDRFNFDTYELKNLNHSLVRDYAIQSGLLRNRFTIDVFDSAYTFDHNSVKLTDKKYKEVLAQVLSNFVVEHLISLGMKCSLETVFSHQSKVNFMRLAAKNDYKVYLYFISTEDPEINKERVKARVRKGGHDVPASAIEERYYRSLGLLFDAAQVADRCYFFDNSGTEDERRLVAEWYRNEKGEKILKITDEEQIPNWLIEYFLNKHEL